MKTALRSRGMVALAAAAAAAGIAVSVMAAPGLPATPLRDRWSPDERATLASMQLSNAGPRPVDASNADERNPDAAALGRTLFVDTRLSRDGKISCATCHAGKREFQDGRALGVGLATGKRRTMPVMGASHSPFLFWDGRKDSAWSQALGPLEDAAEHRSNRTRIAAIVHGHYKERYEKVFGAMPSLGRLPEDASPLGNDAERAAWAAMPEPARDAVNRVFANVGKSIAAYEREIAYGEARFDQYVRATLAGDGRGQEVLTLQEARGLRLFLTKGRCATCHNGPLLTDHAFHNTGVARRDHAAPDRGRADGVRKLLADEFNCLGRYSDAGPEQCGELQFLATDDPGQLGAFRTPSLRNVAARPPYMHAGQFDTLEQVVAHYARSPVAVIGHSELAQPGERPQRARAARRAACGAPGNPPHGAGSPRSGGIPRHADRPGDSAQGVMRLARARRQRPAHLHRRGREAERLGEIPAEHLEQRIAERLGALVLYVDAPPLISGAACQLPALNAILINRNDPEGRRHYDLAHECFHLLTWEQMPPEHREDDIPRGGKGRRVEQLADNFASALLMPERTLLPRWESRGRRDIHNWLNDTASALLVTAVALKWRLVQLEWLGKADLLEIDDARLTANGRPKREQPVPALFSATFIERLQVGLSRGELSVRRAAELLGLTIDALAQLFRDRRLTVPFDL